MANTIKLKRSSTASDTPSASDLEVGELAINTADAKLFTKHTDNSIKTISGSSGGIASVSADTNPSLGGTLDTNSQLIQFGDSSGATVNRLQLGDSQDLSLYHDDNSRVNHNGTGDLYLSSNNNTIFYNSGYAKINIQDGSSGGVKLYYGNATLTAETTSDGLDVQTGIINVKNGGSPSEVRLFCESSNQHYASLKAPAHTDFPNSDNVTLTLPAGTATLLSDKNMDAGAIVSSGVDHVLVSVGGELKRITTGHLGIGSGGGSYANSDVDAHLNQSTANSGEVLSWNGSDYDWVAQSGGGGGGSSTLGGLSDVNITSVADGDLLRYNGTASEWQNTNLGLTVTPTFTLSATSLPYNATALTITVTNHSTLQADDVHYSATLSRSSDNAVMISATSTSMVYTSSYGQHTGTISVSLGGLFGSSNVGNSYYIALTAQTFGDLQSEVATQTFTIAAPPQVSMTGGSYRYWRLTDTSNRMMLTNWRLYSGTNQSGTAYPGSRAVAQSWTSDGQTNSLTASYQYSSTYAAWKAMDNSYKANTVTPTSWWTLGGNGQPYSAITLTWDAGTARSIDSMELEFNDRYTNTVSSGNNAFIIQGSNDNTNWTTLGTVTASDEDLSASGHPTVYTTVLLSDT